MESMKKNRHWLLAGVISLYIAVPGLGLAASAPGELSQVPLFLSQAVQPNIMVVLDDSGSMDWEYLGPNSQTGGHTNIDVCRNGLAYNPTVTYTPWKGVDSNGDTYADADPHAARDYPWAADGQMVDLVPTSAFGPIANEPSGVFGSGLAPNGLKWKDINYRYTAASGWELNLPIGSNNWLSLSAFNPELDNTGNVQYGTWNGSVHSFGNPLPSTSPENLVFEPSNGRLRVAVGGKSYFNWVDANHNGIPEQGECLTSELVAALPLISNSPSSPNSQTNYANWFSYYRKREYVMKKAISEVIWNSKERVGLSGINLHFRRDSHDQLHAGGAGVPVKDMDDLSVGRPAADIALARANKQALLNNLFRMKSDGGTPLRAALDNAGRYFSGFAQNTVTTYTASSSAYPNGVVHTQGLFGGGNLNPAQPLLSAVDGGECQQNFTLLFSDGQRNGNFNSGLFSNADTAPVTSYNGASYADAANRTLADIAMYYYQRDLSTGLANRVLPPDPLHPGQFVPIDLGRNRTDSNPAQHMVTYTIAFGLTGSVDPATQPSDATTPFAWNVPGNNHPVSVAQSADDMYHAAWNGRGRYLSAYSAGSLISALRSVFQDIQDRTSSAAAAVAVSSTSIQSGGKVFQAGFNPADWSGSLSAYAVSSGGVNATPIWDAHDLLGARINNQGWSSRTLLTYNGSNGVLFQMPQDYTSLNPSVDLSQAQVDDLLFNAPLSDPGRGDFLRELIAYFHGDASNEGVGPNLLGFRKRGGHFLGDIIHSSPVFVGRPTSPIKDSNNAYGVWKNDPLRVNRTPVVYVGSNDGMLHAFNAGNGSDKGQELFAYLPKLLFSDKNRLGYHWLAQQDYEHRYYVDQTIAAGDAYFLGEWHTVLVGALGGGGKGLFALDITDPDVLGDPSTAPSKVLWEFDHIDPSHPNDPTDMGFSYAQPTIVQLNNAARDWAVIVGNGYHNTKDGRAKIFVIKLEDGSLIATLDSGVGSVVGGDCSDVASDCNGMSSPTVVDVSGNGAADYVYAGDAKGNLWVFDLRSQTPSNWSSSRRRLITVQTASGALAPITSQPSVAKHPNMRSESTAPNLLVSFSTGQLLAKLDESDATKHSFYTVWDDGSSTAKTRSDLVEQTITQTTKTVGGVTYDIRKLSNNPVDYSATTNPAKGWFIDYIEDGERGITRPLLFGDVVVWTTVTPTAAGATANVCDSAGTSWLMVANYVTGGRPDSPVLDVNGDKVFNADDKIGGHGVGGVHSGDKIYWQPTIVTGGHGGGLALLPIDSTNGVSTESRAIQGISQNGLRSAWGRYNF